MEASEEQNEIINFKGNAIVVANPGTGKTTTLAWKVIKLLKEGVKPEDILCITFTYKAKKEMFDKIHEKKKEIPNVDVAKINIHTFHSFAFNYLLDKRLIAGDIVGGNLLRVSILNNFEKNNALNYEKNYIISDIVPMVERAINHIKSFGVSPDEIDINKSSKILEEIHEEKTYSIEEMKFFLKYFVDAFKEYEKAKGEKIDYSDMLSIFRKKFQDDKIEHVLVDEMQDMNKMEADIVEMISKELFLVGDAKQAIFAFQGGSIENLEKLAKDQKCERQSLTKNRRSYQQIVDYSKEYFLKNVKNMETLGLEEFESIREDVPIDIPKVISTSAPHKNILEVIKNTQEEEIGIITRTNSQIVKISKFLDANNIKYSSTSQAIAQQAKEEIQTYLKGLLSDKIEDKISAAFTIFSSYTLREAFELSHAFKDKDFGKLEQLRQWGIKLVRKELDEKFEEMILPICVAKKSKWFATAISVKKQIDEYLTYETPTLEGLLDFIAIGEYPYTEQNSESKITLTTVHKAKGLEFDTVIYIPNAYKKTSFIDNIVKCIFQGCNVDVQEELDEPLRIDFVALTRAKKRLLIIAKEKEAANYHIEGLSDIKVDDSNDELANIESDSRLNEAYSLFLNGEFEGSKKLLKSEEEWLGELIKNHFQNIDHLSYSSIKTKPYEFLKNNIIDIPSYYEGTKFGSKVHKAMQLILTKEAKIEDYTGDVRKAVQNGIDAIKELGKLYPGLNLIGTEERQNISIDKMTDCKDDKLSFRGVIDVIFKYDQGYVIADYKTNRREESEHKRQLAVYRKMLSILENIPEEQITTCVIYVALRGGVNTGEFGKKISIGAKKGYSTFEKHLKTVLAWKEDPQKFIDELLESTSEELLLAVIKDKLRVQ